MKYHLLTEQEYGELIESYEHRINKACEIIKTKEKKRKECIMLEAEPDYCTCRGCSVENICAYEPKEYSQ